MRAAKESIWRFLRGSLKPPLDLGIVRIWRNFRGRLRKKERRSLMSLSVVFGIMKKDCRNEKIERRKVLEIKILVLRGKEVA